MLIYQIKSEFKKKYTIVFVILQNCDKCCEDMSTFAGPHNSGVLVI